MQANLSKQSALIGCSDEWMCRSLESVFEDKGFAPTRVGSGRKTLKLARTGRFDVVVLDEGLDELPALDVCVALRDDPLFDPSIPIVITSSAHATPKTRMEALAAGAWEYCRQPLDVDGLFLKLATFSRARRALEGIRSEHLTDPASGLYTQFGLEQLSEQLGARALRRHEPFACVAFSPDLPAGTSGRGTKSQERAGFADIANVIRIQSRKSDIVAQTGEARLAILAPDTDAAGARRLVARLQRELATAAESGPTHGGMRLKAGFCAVSDFAEANVELSELVHRAESALDRLAPATGEGIQNFDELPLS